MNLLKLALLLLVSITSSLHPMNQKHYNGTLEIIANENGDIESCSGFGMSKEELEIFTFSRSNQPTNQFARIYPLRNLSSFEIDKLCKTAFSKGSAKLIYSPNTRNHLPEIGDLEPTHKEFLVQLSWNTKKNPDKYTFTIQEHNNKILEQ